MGIVEYFLKVVMEILLFAAVVVGGIIGMRWGLKKTKHPNKARTILVGGFFVYLGVIAYVTIFSRNSSPDMSVESSVFRGMTNAVELIGKFLKSCYYFLSNQVWLPLERPDINIVHIREGTLNLLLFVPLGYLLSAVLPYNQNSKIWRIVFAGVLVIISIELIQLFARLGSFDLDDLINNTLGVVLGAGMYARYIATDLSGER